MIVATVANQAGLNQVAANSHSNANLPVQIPILTRTSTAQGRSNRQE
ncbi:hypothetical protein [Microcoleus sp. FACHB-672]|nr:hypothetical protein [Microcoleus sp. FACHB-672]MBD2039595.1 hypothetical protein [Microcoleus sp. FACHB-672]